jgi:hypothetical protein
MQKRALLFNYRHKNAKILKLLQLLKIVKIVKFVVTVAKYHLINFYVKRKNQFFMFTHYKVHVLAQLLLIHL